MKIPKEEEIVETLAVIGCATIFSIIAIIIAIVIYLITGLLW